MWVFGIFDISEQDPSDEEMKRYALLADRQACGWP